MVGPDFSEVEARFSSVRKKLDEGGYLESFGLDSLRLVEHLFTDLVKTTESLQKTLVEYGQYKKVAKELEDGVAPFKEENVRLYKENSQLRMGIARALEEAEDKARAPFSRLRDLEAENNDLKLLVSQFAERVKKADIESLEKTKRIAKLQEKEIGASINVKGEQGKKVMSQHSKQMMELDYYVPDACPQCIRLRNYVEYGKGSDRNPKALDYMKLADSRIEALQLQLRNLKNSEKEHLSLIASLKGRVGTREAEIEKLREMVRVRPGRDNIVNAFSQADSVNGKMERSLAVELKTAELQLQILQRRNLELEDKLKTSILQEHEDYMLGKIPMQLENRNVLRGFLEKELDKYPSHDKMSLLEKLYHLERQLSHCCKEKAVLRKLLEECRSKHRLMSCQATVKFEHATGGKVHRKSARVISNGKTTTLARTGIRKQAVASEKLDRPSVNQISGSVKLPVRTDKSGSIGITKAKAKFFQNSREHECAEDGILNEEESEYSSPSSETEEKNINDIDSSDGEKVNGEVRFLSEHKSDSRTHVVEGEDIMESVSEVPGIHETKLSRTGQTMYKNKNSMEEGKGTIHGRRINPTAIKDGQKKFTSHKSKSPKYLYPVGFDVKSKPRNEVHNQRQVSTLSGENQRANSQSKEYILQPEECYYSSNESVEDDNSSVHEDMDFNGNSETEGPEQSSHTFQKSTKLETIGGLRNLKVRLNKPTGNVIKEEKSNRLNRHSNKETRNSDINPIPITQQKQRISSNGLRNSQDISERFVEPQASRNIKPTIRNKLPGKVFTGPKKHGHVSGAGISERQNKKAAAERMGSVQQMINEESEGNFSEDDSHAKQTAKERSFSSYGKDQGGTVIAQKTILPAEQSLKEFPNLKTKTGRSQSQSQTGNSTKTSVSGDTHLRQSHSHPSGTKEVADDFLDDAVEYDEDSEADNDLSQDIPFQLTHDFARKSDAKDLEKQYVKEANGVNLRGKVVPTTTTQVKGKKTVVSDSRKERSKIASSYSDSKLVKASSGQGQQLGLKAFDEVNLRATGDATTDDRKRSSKESVPESYRHNSGPSDSKSRSSDQQISKRDIGTRRDKSIHGISLVEQPSLLSISEFEKELTDTEGDVVIVNTNDPNLRTERNVSVVIEKGSVSETSGDVFDARKGIPKGYGMRREMDARKTLGANSHFQGSNVPSSSYPQSDHSSQRRTASQMTAENLSVPNQYSNTPTKADFPSIADKEFNRAGVVDATASYGEGSEASFSRRGDRDTAGLGIQRRGLSDLSSQSQDRSALEDRSRIRGSHTYNPDNRNRVSMRSVAVNTEDASGNFWLDLRTESQEKELVDKITVLQKKMDDLHAESSQHQLKSFELQGELERTKHMLQVEKKERELALTELKRIREQSSEATARLLMNSALGSDGSFRRGITPMEMEREIVNLRAALASLDRDKDEMRVELDRKDEKLARVTNDASNYMNEISQLKLALKNAELNISHVGETSKEQWREAEFLKKQLESNRRDMEKAIRERDDALRELHKISGAHAKGQLERRSVETELVAKNKEADDLRRQVQRYIDEVRRIEELLLDKEEEMEMLIQHYRALTAENSHLEAQRTSLEREASSIRESVRDAVDQNISFKTQLSSQNALVQSLEAEIQRLSQEVSQLENQMDAKVEKEKILESDLKASKDLLYRIEIQMDKLKLDLSDCESKRKQLEAENSELNAHISSLESRLQEEADRQKQLESLVASSREKDFQNERSALGISRERDELAEKLTNLQQRSESLNTEVSRYRLKSIELQNELDRTRRQLDNEKRERETALVELRRVREQLNSSSANYLLNTALGTTGSSGSQIGEIYTDSSTRHTISTSGSILRQNLTVAEMRHASSREQSPQTMPNTPTTDLQLETPIAASTSRNDDQPTERSNQTGDEFEAWDSPKQ